MQKTLALLSFSYIYFFPILFNPHDLNSSIERQWNRMCLLYFLSGEIPLRSYF